MPALGLGTWHIGESRHSYGAEVRALRCALEIGYRLIDTAEMYGEGGAERVIGEAVAAALVAGDVSREDLFVVSKSYRTTRNRRGTRRRVSVAWAAGYSSRASTFIFFTGQERTH